MSPSKLVDLKLFMPMALSFAIPVVLCQSMWSPPYVLVGSTGGGGGGGVNVEKSIQPLFISYF